MSRISVRNVRGVLRFLGLRLLIRRVNSNGIAFVGRHADFDIRRPGQLFLGNGTYVSDNFTAVCRGRIHIGDRVYFNKSVLLAAYEEITIGSDTLLGPMVTIFDNEHRADAGPARYSGFDTAAVQIGRNVVIGAKATILMGVTIGDNCRIGANSVVLTSIPANSVAVGAPARVVANVGPA